MLAEVRSGEEAKEGLSAFFEKRSPAWVSGERETRGTESGRGSA